MAIYISKSSQSQYQFQERLLKKNYVEAVFRPKSHLHKEFVRWYKEEKHSEAGELRLLKKILKEQNIAIHAPGNINAIPALALN